MKITIDTKEDSKEEIKKVIQMLSNLVKGDIVTNAPDIFSSSEKPAKDNAFADMFSAPEEPTPTEEPADTPMDFSGFTNLVEKKEDKEDVEVISY